MISFIWLFPAIIFGALMGICCIALVSAGGSDDNSDVNETIPYDENKKAWK